MDTSNTLSVEQFGPLYCTVDNSCGPYYNDGTGYLIVNQASEVTIVGDGTDVTELIANLFAVKEESRKVIERIKDVIEKVEAKVALQYLTEEARLRQSFYSALLKVTTLVKRYKAVLDDASNDFGNLINQAIKLLNEYQKNYSKLESLNSRVVTSSTIPLAEDILKQADRAIKVNKSVKSVAEKIKSLVQKIDSVYVDIRLARSTLHEGTFEDPKSKGKYLTLENVLAAIEELNNSSTSSPLKQLEYDLAQIITSSSQMYEIPTQKVTKIPEVKLDTLIKQLSKNAGTLTYAQLDKLIKKFSASSAYVFYTTKSNEKMSEIVRLFNLVIASAPIDEDTRKNLNYNVAQIYNQFAGNDFNTIMNDLNAAFNAAAAKDDQAALRELYVTIGKYRKSIYRNSNDDILLDKALNVLLNTVMNKILSLNQDTPATVAERVAQQRNAGVGALIQPGGVAAQNFQLGSGESNPRFQDIMNRTYVANSPPADDTNRTSVANPPPADDANRTSGANPPNPDDYANSQNTSTLDTEPMDETGSVIHADTPEVSVSNPVSGIDDTSTLGDSSGSASLMSSMSDNRTETFNITFGSKNIPPVSLVMSTRPISYTADDGYVWVLGVTAYPGTSIFTLMNLLKVTSEGKPARKLINNKNSYVTTYLFDRLDKNDTTTNFLSALRNIFDLANPQMSIVLQFLFSASPEQIKTANTLMSTWITALDAEKMFQTVRLPRYAIKSLIDFAAINVINKTWIRDKRDFDFSKYDSMNELQTFVEHWNSIMNGLMTVSLS